MILGKSLSLYLKDTWCLLPAHWCPSQRQHLGQLTYSYLLSLQLGRPPYISEWADVVRRKGQVQQEAGSTLYVEEARAGDAGVYICHATNLQGTGTATTRVRVTRNPGVSPAPS